MDVVDIENLIIELLAENAGLTSDELRAVLEARGGNLPVDSLETAEILVPLGEAIGVLIPLEQVTSDDLSSVRSLAGHLQALWSVAATDAQAGA